MQINTITVWWEAVLATKGVTEMCGHTEEKRERDPVVTAGANRMNNSGNSLLLLFYFLTLRKVRFLNGALKI